MRTTQRVFLVGLWVAAGLPLAILTLYALGSAWSFPRLLPQRLDARALVYLWSQAGPLITSLLSSLGYSLATALLSLVLCLAPARVLAWRRFRGQSLLEGALLAPALVPAMTFSMGVHYWFIRWGLAETYPGVVLVLTIFTYPYMLRALVAGFQTFGPDYYRCARNLGAGPLTALVLVELPLLLPAVVAGCSLVFLVAFSEYFLVFLIGGGVVPSFTGYLFPFLTSSDRSVASALTLIFLAIPLALFVVVDMVVRVAQRRTGRVG